MPPAPSPKKSPAKAPFSVTGRTPPPPHSRPAYLANRRAPREDPAPRQDRAADAAEQPRPVPMFRDTADEAKTPDSVKPPARAVHHDAPLSDRSASESRSTRDRSASPTKASVLPCVAHPVYTKHQNCGCLRSRSASPNKQPTREAPAKTKTVWDAPPPPPRPPSPPPAPVFEAPHRLASLNCQNLRHVAATGPMTVMSTEGNGNSVKARNSVTGVTLPAEDANGNPTALPTPEVAITAMASVDDYVWCGFLDGTVRVFRRDTNELVCEPPMKHAGAVQCFAHVPSQGAVFSGSADWKIFKWTRSGQSQWRGVLYAGHSLGVRDLCEAEVATGTYLCSAGDDAEVRCWLLAASSAAAIQGADRSSSPVASPKSSSSSPTTAAPAPIVLKKHRDSVLSCMHAFGHLWTGGEDTVVRRWDIDKQRQAAELTGHSSGVLSMKRVSSSVWTLGKDGTGIMFDGESSAAVHTMSFIDGGIKAGVPRTFAAQLFYVMPVVGHVLWISDPAGRTAAWFAPAALNDATTDADASRVTRGGAEAAFVDSERYVELVFEAEESQRQLLKVHGDLVEEYTTTVANAIDEGYTRAVRDVAVAADGAATADEMAQLRDRIQELELLLNHANEDIEVPAPPADGADRIGTHDDDFVAELQADLAAAKGVIGELQQQLADGDEADALEKLRALANEARQAALAAEQERDAAIAQLEDANAAMSRLRENMDSDTGVLDQRIQDLETEVTELRLELDSKAVEIAALRIAKEEAERPSDELARLRERVLELEHAETERDMARQELSEASALLKQLQAELRDRDEMLDKLLMEKDEAVARLSQVDVDSMKTLADARTETKRLARMLEEANAEMRALRESEQDWKDIAEQRHSDLLRLNGEMKDRDKNEAAVRVSYEERIAELVDRLRVLEEALGANEDVSGSLSAAEADREALRAKLAEFTSPRYQDLLNENVELKRQLGEHKSHINRLLENDVKTESLLKDLRERARQSRAEEAVRFSARQRSASPSDNGPHDPTCPHHRASCIWCSGAINISMGTTLNTGRNSNHRSPSSQERSRSRSPGGDHGRSNSAMAAPSALKGAGPSGGMKRSESAPTQAAIEPPAFDGSPRTQQRKKDRRVHQLEQAKEATGNEAVRAALVEQILSIHKTFIDKDVPRGEGDV